jgi:excisionase family DNA binding protein
MNSEILLVLPGVGTLRLPAEVFAQHLEPIDPPQPPTATAPEPWLDSRQLAAIVGVGDTTIEGMAARGEIPSLRCGKALRFKLTEVEAALRPRDKGTPARSQHVDLENRNSGRNRNATAKAAGFPAREPPAKGSN